MKSLLCFYLILVFFCPLKIIAQDFNIGSFKKGMNEDKYIKEIVAFYGSNKLASTIEKTGLQINKAFIKYNILSRDKEGYFIRVFGYCFIPNKNQDTSYNFKKFVTIDFDKGVPYQFEAGDWFEISTTTGKYGQLNLTSQEILKVNKLNNIKEKFSNVNDLIKFQKDIYSNTECNCLEKVNIDRSYTETLDKGDRDWERTKTHYKSGIAFRNKCNYDIYLVSVIKLYDYKTKSIYYEDETFRIKANSEYKDPIVIYGSNSMRKANVYTPVEVDPVYSDAKNDFNDYQILRVVKANSNQKR